MWWLPMGRSSRGPSLLVWLRIKVRTFRLIANELKPCCLEVQMLSLALLLLAHSFYSAECCNENDCHPVEARAVTSELDGYHYKNYVIWYDDKRVKDSPDGQYHVCEGVYPYSNRVFCLYVPKGIS